MSTGKEEYLLQRLDISTRKEEYLVERKNVYGKGRISSGKDGYVY